MEKQYKERIAMLENRVAYLEEQRRQTLGIIESASEMAQLQMDGSQMESPLQILKATEERTQRLLPFVAQGYYLVDENDGDIKKVHVSARATDDGKDHAEAIEAAVEYFIDKAVFAWALKERKPTFLFSEDKCSEFILHPIATANRIRGMFIGKVKSRDNNIFDTTLALLSVVLFNCANALESHELYRWIRDINANLETKVAELACSQDELIEHREHLQEMVGERTRTLDSTVERLQSALEERDALLKEIHHRVKNNLQVISSLLNLQVGYLDDRVAINSLQDAQNRIRSMAIVHDVMYRSGNLSEVNMADYMQSLMRELLRLFSVNRACITTEVNVASCLLDLERAIPCGLIVTELLTNAMQHAFPNDMSGTIRLGVAMEDGMVMVTVEDDGVGMEEVVDPENAQSLGLRLISVLSSQLRGTFRFKQGKGTTGILSFPM